MSVRFLLAVAFAAIIVVFLVLDLGVFNRKAHAVSLKAAAWQSAFWVAISLIFAGAIFSFYDASKGWEFLSAYATEKMLSVDNLFVMLLIFNFFSIEDRYQHRVLFYGILGALFMRALFIGLGAVVISLFHWVLYIFGGILIYTGFKLFKEKKEEHIDFSDRKLYRILHRTFRFSKHHHSGRFITHEDGVWYLTTLFLVLLIIEWTDLVFAIDSIPAVFSISQDPLIVYTSNVFAILGLRSMFFLLEAIIHRFHHLQKGLSLVLIAIGGKMLLDIVDIHISSAMSFGIVAACLLGSLALSLLFPKKF